MGDSRFWGVGRGVLFVGVEGVGEFPADGHPFSGFQVVVLEEEH